MSQKFAKNFYNVLLTILLISIFSHSIIGLAQSTSRIDSLEIKLNQTTSDSLKVIYEIKISRELHRKRDREKEDSLAQNAVARALQLKDTLLYAKALDNLGLLKRFHQYYQQALDLHIKGFDLVKNRKDVAPQFKMILANNAGVAARYDEKYDTAIFYYMKALKLAERENDLKDIAIASNGIGNALGNIPGREEEALTYFLRALDVEKKRENSLGLAMNYLSICHYYINKEEYKTAREYLDKLLQINKERKDKFGLAITYEFMGIANLKEGENLKQAVAYFKNALGRFSTLENEKKQAEILNHLGNTSLKQGKLNLAVDYFQKSIGLAKKLQQNELLRANSMKLSEILEKRENYKEALYYYKEVDAYKDSIKLTEQNIRIEALTRKYNLEKKENRIQLLEKDKALQQTIMENQKQQLKRRRLVMLLLGIAFLLLLIIFCMQFRNYRTKKKTTARIQKEEKEKMNAIYERNLAQSEILVTRLRVNPHFLFNNLNAITYLIQSEQNLKAIKYLKIFSRYTRMVLETSKQQTIPLRQELKLAHYYLILEENRFEDGFIFQITGDELAEIEEVNIPPLLLQPFIENAIWHGLLPSTKDLRMLNIAIIPKAKSIEILIDDNGVGRKAPKKQSTLKNHKSMGMQIIKDRVQLHNKINTAKISYKIIDKKNESGQTEGTRIVLVLLQDSSVNTGINT